LVRGKRSNSKGLSVSRGKRRDGNDKEDIAEDGRGDIDEDDDKER